MPSPRKIRVLIVDDSATVRQTLAVVLESDPEIEVMGVASDPFIAAKRIRDEVPDVITLDVEMPRMDGITFLRRLMSQHPIPVVMCSSLTEAGSETLLQALEAGAVDVILKPKMGVAEHLAESKIRICDAVKAAAGARIPGRRAPAPTLAAREPEKKLTADVICRPGRGRAIKRTTETIVCIGTPPVGPKPCAWCSRRCRRGSRHRHRPAHAGEVHRLLRQAAGQPVRWTSRKPRTGTRCCAGGC